MFNSIVDQYTKNVKSVYSFIPGKDLRERFEALADAQAVYSKALIATGMEVAKVTADEITKVAKPK